MIFDGAEGRVDEVVDPASTRSARSHRSGLDPGRHHAGRRDLLGWVDPNHRFAQKHGIIPSPGAPVAAIVRPIVSADAPVDTVADICDVTSPTTPFEVVLAALWTLRIEAFETVVVTGTAFPAFSYRELNQHRDRTVARLLRSLGQDTPDNRVRVIRAYGEDSQQGTASARDQAARDLDDARRARVLALSRDHARVRAAVEYMDTMV